MDGYGVLLSCIWQVRIGRGDAAKGVLAKILDGAEGTLVTCVVVK